MSATRLSDNSWGIDTSGKLTSKMMQTLASQELPIGKKPAFLFRYVSRGTPSVYDITADEARACVDSGMILCIVQYGPPSSPWPVDASHGTQHGQAAATNASGVGYPQGAHIFLDMEGLHPMGEVVEEYVQAWCAAVHAAGYLAGVYVGFASGLTADQWASLTCVDLFWCDAADRTPPTGVGFAIKQHMTINSMVLPVDPDFVSPDLKGRMLIGMGPDINQEPVDPSAGGASLPAAGTSPS
jgi:hypothetical protein